MRFLKVFCLEPLKSSVACWMRKIFNFPLSPFNNLKKSLTIFTSDRHEKQWHIYFPCFFLSLPVLGGLFLHWKKEWLGAGLSFTSNTFTCLHAFIRAISAIFLGYIYDNLIPKFLHACLYTHALHVSFTGMSGNANCLSPPISE